MKHFKWKYKINKFNLICRDYSSKLVNQQGNITSKLIINMQILERFKINGHHRFLNDLKEVQNYNSLKFNSQLGYSSKQDSNKRWCSSSSKHWKLNLVECQSVKSKHNAKLNSNRWTSQAFMISNTLTTS